LEVGNGKHYEYPNFFGITTPTSRFNQSKKSGEILRLRSEGHIDIVSLHKYASPDQCDLLLYIVLTDDLFFSSFGSCVLFHC